jgi:hypothetical protein
MPRISSVVPMKAYDHVAELLLQKSGGDGVISRADAKRLVAELKAEGKGTEALAANNIFKMIDARDQGRGARVTGYDLKRDRAFVEEKMIKNRDINKNGLARAEIEKMSPTGQALVELGRVLAIKKKAGRISQKTPERGLMHVAALLTQAAGSDRITSKADINNLAKALLKQGRGTEALAVGTFGAFIDFRDAGRNNRITKRDIDKAVAYGKEVLLKAKDKNNNGYSLDETSKFSKSAKAFLLLGRMIDAGVLKSAAA